MLPNIRLSEAIEGPNIALAPHSDQRVQAINESHSEHKRFTESFCTPFGTPVKPAVLIWHPHYPEKLRTLQCITSFCNIVALSVITLARARFICGASVLGPMHSRCFDFYPYSLDKQYKNLIADNESILALNSSSKFNGQVWPDIPVGDINNSRIDWPLYNCLITRWQRRYQSKNPPWTDIALMRSLNMAYHASSLPAPFGTLELDQGRMIALWVSAFEILFHPGGQQGRSDKWKVCNALSNSIWKTRILRLRNLKRPRPKTLLYRPKTKHQAQNDKRVTLPVWIYLSFDIARNDFLHGNPIESGDLYFDRSKDSMLLYTAPLYRLALTSALHLKFSEEAPPITDADATGKYINGKIKFEIYQEASERAISEVRNMKDK